MSPWLTWFAFLAVGVVAVVRAVSVDARVTNLAICGALAAVYFALAIVEDRRMRRSGTAASALAAGTARQMALVWVWGALSLAITYLWLLQWREWWQFFLGFALAGTLSLGLSHLLQRDAVAGKEDETMLKLARGLAWAQLVGMAAAIVGLFVDGKVTRHLNPVKYPDWAGNHIFLAGAAALFAISAYALVAGRKQATS